MRKVSVVLNTLSMTALSPIIQLLHASDAPQHTGEMKTILQRMKAENRISDFTALDITQNSGNLSFKNEDRQGIIVLLTNEIERVRTEIENLLKNITREKQDIKLIEIIVDNLPYHNNFISFPQDLMPIRSRMDMNLVWNGIEEDLQAIFPKPPEVQITPVPTTDPKKYLKLIGVSVLAVALCSLFFAVCFPGIRSEPFAILATSSFLLPIIIFLLQKKNLEVLDFPSQEPKRITGAINWKQLFMKTGTVMVIFLEIFFVLSVLLMFMGLFTYTSPAVFTAVITLLLLFYRGKSERSNEFTVQKKVAQTPVKKYLKLFGALVLFFVLSLILSIIIMENLPSRIHNNELYNIYHDKDYYILSLSILTTICILIIVQRRKQLKPSP